MPCYEMQRVLRIVLVPEVASLRSKKLVPSGWFALSSAPTRRIRQQWLGSRCGESALPQTKAEEVLGEADVGVIDELAVLVNQ